ncbi:hypothetical protein lerEdw1_004455, partial [Lerista edwardsae]
APQSRPPRSGGGGGGRGVAWAGAAPPAAFHGGTVRLRRLPGLLQYVLGAAPESPVGSPGPGHRLIATVLMKGFKLACTASNSNRSTPACSPILRKRSRSPTPQDPQGDTMVEKGSDHSSDKSPSTPEQGVQRSCSSQSGRSGAKNSKVSPVACGFTVLYPREVDSLTRKARVGTM